MPLDRFKDKFSNQVNALKQAKIAGRLSHAFLLYADNAQFREEFVTAFAQMVVCRTPTETGDACGTCQTCTQLATGKYPEFFILMPTSKSRKIVIGDENTPDTMRYFERQFYLTSTTEAEVKFGIIQDAECMSNEAQNAFLKTLEEPPGNSIFILTTGSPASLLPTTRSRCQTLLLLENSCQYDFNGCSELFSVLYELCFNSSNISSAEKCASTIIRLTKELKDEAIARVEENRHDEMEKAEELAELGVWDSSTKKHFDKRMENAGHVEYLNIREQFLSAIHSWIAQVYQLAYGIDISLLANPEIIEAARERQNIDENKIFKMVKIAEQLLNNLKWNVDEELAIRDFCLSIFSVNQQ